MFARYTWADPDESLLEDTRGDLPGFPDDVLPPRLLAWLERAAYGAGVRTDHVAIPLLGVASSLIGTARRVRASSSWTEPMTLWTCLIGVSGERKTSAILVTKRALDLIEKDAEPAVDKMRHAHQARIEQAREELKQWREARQKGARGETAARSAAHGGRLGQPRRFHLSATLRDRPNDHKAGGDADGTAARHDVDPR